MGSFEEDVAKRDRARGYADHGSSPREFVAIIVAVIVVSIGAVGAMTKYGSAGRPQDPAVTAIEFTPSDSYCADVPRLAAAYRAEHERVMGHGSVREQERALFTAALRDLAQLSEACAGEAKALHKEAEWNRLESEAAAGRLLDVLSEGYPCCDEDNAVVFVGCPEKAE